MQTFLLQNRGASSTTRRCWIAVIALLSSLLSGPGLRAQTSLYWTGGGGTWDTTTSQWSSNVDGSTPLETWVNADPANDAVFGLTAGTVTLSEPVTARSLTFTTDGYTIAGGTLTLSDASIDTGSGTQTISSVLAGSSLLFTKSGSGTLVLSGANTLAATSELIVSGGTLAIRGSGASLGIAGAASRINVGAGAFKIDSGGTAKNTSSVIGNSGTVTVDGAGSTWTLTGGISVGSGGNGTLTISNGGKVIDTDSDIGYGEAGSGSATVTGAGSVWFTKGMRIGSTANSEGTLTIENGGVVHNAGTAVNLGGGATAVAHLVVTGAGSLLTGGLPTDVVPKKTGLQVGALGTATVLVSDGGKINGSSGSIGGGTTVDDIGKGDVTVTGVGSSWTMSSVFNMNGQSTLTIADGGAVTSAGSTIGGSAISTSTVTIGGNGASWTASSSVVLGDFGSGTLNLNAGGSFSTGAFLRLGGEDGGSGTIIQTGGTLTVGTYLDFSAGTPVYRLEGGTLIAGGSEYDAIYVNDNTEGYTFELAGGTVQAKGVDLVSYANATLRNGTVSTLSTPTSSTQEMYWEGIISGGGGLMKTGAGVLYLDKVNTYTGATTVNAGTLLVNGSLASSAVTVASGATLGGSGTIGGHATFASGAHLAPGNLPGTITFTGGLTLNDGTILDLQLGTISDKIVVSGGTLTGPFSGTITVNLSDSGGFVAGTYTLIDATGATLTSIGATSLELGTTIAGYDFTFTQNGDLFQLTAIASAVPEPSTCAALAGVCALGLAAWRRRRF
ncbi:MAG TPA: autotransporter-associated beta strand repeat-containing protein [Rariglobus sp.]|nr:autotransporter-associated beta strand repeat-containing protein [Rariglobus sp.]